jgi:hypothetical protein
MKLTGNMEPQPIEYETPRSLRPVLDYGTVEDYRIAGAAPPNAVRAAAWFRFTGAVAASYLIASWVEGGADTGAFVPLAAMTTLLSGLVFVIVTLMRGGFLRLRPVERSSWLTLAAGAACVVVPDLVRIALLGHVDNTMPWLLTGWAVMATASSFIIYPKRDPMD